MSEIDAVVNGPVLRTHKNRVVALLRHFKDQGRTLKDCKEELRVVGDHLLQSLDYGVLERRLADLRRKR